MRQTFSRQSLGSHFSEAARLLWLALQEKGWGQQEATRQLGMPSGQISKLLYGERKAGRVWAGKLKEQLRIDPSLWDKPPTVPFVPPAARPAARKGSPKRKAQVRKAGAADPVEPSPASSKNPRTPAAAPRAARVA